MNHWIWETLEWADAIDIGVMAFILYRTMLVIQGTRAIQSLVGLLVLLGLYLVANALHLVSVTWLFDKLFVYIVLAVIILFQDDIRRGLASAGGRLFTRLRRNAELSIYEEIIKASFVLASRRIGALIAIERGASLEEYVEPATQIEGRVSQELLLAIFHPTSPLHDGAVILQKGRISAAKAFLPLTQSKNISRFFGTRHRAAIGLAEETDAVVIVVSEERGTVSIVEHGEVRPTADANELREALQKLLSQPMPPTSNRTIPPAGDR